MRNFIRYTALIFLMACTCFSLISPYGISSNTEEALIDSLQPIEINYGFDPLFGFCLYTPFIFFLESFFIKRPFSTWQRIIFIVQFTGVILTAPFAIFIPLGIPFGRVEPYPFAGFIAIYTLYLVFWHLFLIIPACDSWKLVTWPFSKRRTGI